MARIVVVTGSPGSGKSTVAHAFLEEGIPYVDGIIAGMPKDGWVVIDSSQHDVDETVGSVLALL
jgi:adenylylsulfate kinase-like enzyme